MVCIVTQFEKPLLKDPVLIEGLPGIGFVANIATLHLIKELGAHRFAEIHCSSFQDYAVTDDDGQACFPVNELYYHKSRGGERDLLFLYGNTQALTTTGQYELCGRVLNLCEDLGCRYVITLGGLKRDTRVDKPKLYFASSDKKTSNELLGLGAEVIRGQIFGIAGLLIGVGKLRQFQGFCLLAETLGLYPDSVAAREVLKVIRKMLNLQVNLEGLDVTTEATKALMENFGLLERSMEDSRKSSEFRWFV